MDSKYILIDKSTLSSLINEVKNLTDEIRNIKLQAPAGNQDAKIEDPLLTSDQVMRRLKISRTTFWRRLKNHAFPFIKRGNIIYVRESDLEEYISENNVWR